MKKILLIANFALLGVNSANAVKQCVLSGDKYAFNNANGSFVGASNCTGTPEVEKCSGIATTATYSGTGAPSNYTMCSGIKYAGISACISSGSDPAQGSASGEVCLCKITYPLEGLWVFNRSSSFWRTNCAQSCAEICGCYTQGFNDSWRATMMGGTK